MDSLILLCRRAFRRRRRAGLALLAVLWAVGVGAGFNALHAYSARPGTLGTAPSQWSLTPAAGVTAKPRLVLIAHPQCPCTRATLEVFAALLVEAGPRVEAEVVFYRPDAEEDSWAHTPLWDRAAALPGVTVRSERESRLPLGEGTSGTVLLYSAEGQLLFQGGLTAARGEIGDSASRAALLTWLHRGTSTLSQAPVFGCPLSDTPTRAFSSNL